MITVTKKHMLLICFILLFFGNKCFSEETYSINYNNNYYSISSTFSLIWDYVDSERISNKRTSELKEKSFYYCLNENEQIRDLYNKNMEIKITHNKDSLFFNLGTIIYDKAISDCRIPQLAFFPDYNAVEVLYYDSLFSNSHRCKVIRFDFEKNTVNVIFEYQISDLFYSIFKTGKNYSFAEEIYSRIYKKHFLSENVFTCYTGDEPLCGGWADFIYTTVSGNIIVQDPYNENSNKKKFFSNRLKNSRPKGMLTNKDFVSRSAEQLLLNNTLYNSQSFLVEGKTEYRPSNLSSFSEIPFVPNIPYKDEEIVIVADKDIAGLFICNGFYHQDKTNLFNENCRPKEIEIIYDDSYNLQHHIILEDIQNPQFIPLLNINEKKIRIKIISVYAGTKYKDVCINCIQPVGKYSEFDFFNSQK